MSSILENLRRTRMVQWGVAYLAGAWAVLEFLDLLVDRFGWPEAWIAKAIAGLAFGRAMILIVAWFHGQKGRQRVRSLEVGLLAFVALTAGITIWLIPSPAPNEPVRAVRQNLPSPSETRLAILPLANHSPNPDADEYAVSGLHDEIITQVSKISALEVVSRASVMRYRDSDARDLDVVAADLGVWYVMEGSLRHAGDQMRVSARLVDTRTDRTLWSQAYDRPFTASDLLSVQADLAVRIASALEVRLAPSEMVRIERTPTRDDLAYDTYLRGIHAWGGGAAAGVPEANRWFAEAVGLDSTFAEAWTGLAGTYVGMGNFFLASPEESFQQAEVAARRALALDPGQTAAYTWLGWVHLARYEWSELDVVLARAEVSGPLDGQMRYLRAYAAQARGDAESAVTESRKALALDPGLGGRWRALARMLHMARRFDEAVTTFHRALEVEPEGTGAHLYLTLSLEQLDRLDEAAWELERAALAGGRTAEEVRVLRTRFEETGMSGAWQQWLDWQLESESPRPGPVAITYARLGRADEAASWLERGVEARDSWLFQLRDPLWDPVRGDPRFGSIMRRIGLDPDA
jgi:serine/threonine-protein kinase